MCVGQVSIRAYDKANGGDDNVDTEDVLDVAAIVALHVNDGMDDDGDEEREEEEAEANEQASFRDDLAVEEDEINAGEGEWEEAMAVTYLKAMMQEKVAT